MPDFVCGNCEKDFSLPRSVVERYPGWAPRLCMDCRDLSTASRAKDRAPLSSSSEDPDSGVFTDGSSVPNPGPGGWGAVYVLENNIVKEAYGHDGETTNNRMELLALINAVDLVPQGTSATVFSDSNVAVRTINEWASGWEKRGWKRRTGPVENLDLVKRVFAAYRKRPELEVRWIRAHVGFRWNEYADELANRGRTEG